MKQIRHVNRFAAYHPEAGLNLGEPTPSERRRLRLLGAVVLAFVVGLVTAAVLVVTHE